MQTCVRDCCLPLPPVSVHAHVLVTLSGLLLLGRKADLRSCMCAGGITNNAYIFFVGMLMAQFTFTGYDACALNPAFAHSKCIAWLACLVWTAALTTAS